MLTHISLQNFKSWRTLDLELAPLTLLFGTNSSGKSNVLQALLLLKQTLNSTDLINFGGTGRDYVDFGSWRNLVHNQQVDEKVGIHLKWDEAKRYEYEIVWQQENKINAVDKLLYRIDDETFSIQKLEGTTYRFNINGLVFVSQRSSPATTWVFPQTFSPTGIDVNDELAIVLNTMFNTADLLPKLTKSIQYMGPLRLYPRRTYEWTGNRPQEIGSQGENAIETLLAAQRGLLKNRSLLEEINRWFQASNLLDELSIEALDRDQRFYELLVRVRNVKTPLIDVGFGVSQVLPVITLLLSAPRDSIILLEQPELHLHPSAQAQLADLFLYVAQKQNLQLIIESHSEHLLRRLQRRIAEVDEPFATPENIKTYFCDMGEQGSTLQEVEVDEYGQIRNFPPNFFGDLRGELEALTDAAIARRRQELNGG